MTETAAKYVATGLFLLLLVMLSGCAVRERAVIESVSDNGCRIDKVETSTGPRGRSAIIVECK